MDFFLVVGDVSERVRVKERESEKERVVFTLLMIASNLACAMDLDINHFLEFGVHGTDMTIVYLKIDMVVKLMRFVSIKKHFNCNEL